jgi:arginase family enzyme
LSLAITVLRARTSDRTGGGLRGALALGGELGRRLGVEPELEGMAQAGAEPRDWSEDLPSSSEALELAANAVSGPLAEGATPVLLASDCSICMATLPAVLAARPEARILWLDAHGDSNTPASTPSGFLGGMCLGAAIGRWHAGTPTIEASRVVLCGARDLDPDERTGLEELDLLAVNGADALARLGDAPVYVHLDVDVLDPSVLPSQFPAPGGLMPSELELLLEGIAGAGRLIGVEITAFEAPEDQQERTRLAKMLADAIAPALSAKPQA